MVTLLVALLVYVPSTEPNQITSEKNVESSSDVAINWRNSSRDILRYIVDFRQFMSDGAGKIKNGSISGYPRELPATQLELTVKNLSEVY